MPRAGQHLTPEQKAAMSAAREKTSERHLDHRVLTVCLVCRVSGPTARLTEHILVDHGLVGIGAPRAFVVESG